MGLEVHRSVPCSCVLVQSFFLVVLRIEPKAWAISQPPTTQFSKRVLNNAIESQSWGGPPVTLVEKAHDSHEVIWSTKEGPTPPPSNSTCPSYGPWIFIKEGHVCFPFSPLHLVDPACMTAIITTPWSHLSKQTHLGCPGFYIAPLLTDTDVGIPNLLFADPAHIKTTSPQPLPPGYRRHSRKSSSATLHSSPMRNLLLSHSGNIFSNSKMVLAL